MAFQQENISDSALSGFTSELVALSTGISPGVVDSTNNVYILDEKKLYFGSEREYFFSLNAPKTSLSLFDISGGSLFSFSKDGSIGLKENSGNIDFVAGNLVKRSDGLYLKI